MKCKSYVYGFDTETDNDGISRSWIVQWCLYRQDGQHWTGTEQRTFIHVLKHLYYDDKKLHYIYVHNLDYDWYFIFDELQKFCNENEITIVPIVRNGKIISVTLGESEEFEDRKIIFRDSQKKIIGSSVQSLGKMIGLPKLENPSENNFEIGWSQKVNFDDKENWKYVIRDAEIVCKAMKNLHQKYLISQTQAGDQFRQMRKFLRSSKAENPYHNNDLWKEYFPLLNHELDFELRRQYFGGLNISQYQGKIIAQNCKDKLIVHEDVHSMYPAVMTYDDLPIGIPTISATKPESENTLYIVDTRIKLRLKENRFMWFAFKTGLDYQIEKLPYGTVIGVTRDWHEILLTNIDLKILRDWYDVTEDEDYPKMYYIFNSRKGIFAEYIKEKMAIKEASEKNSLEYVNAKIAMNSGYGRFALSKENLHCWVSFDNDLDKFVFESENIIDDEMPSYIPFQIFVTAHARRRLLENCLALTEEGKRIFHCDTDSVIHEGKPSEKISHGEHLGQWGIESYPQILYEGGFKRYLEIFGDGIKSLKDVNIACAGVPQRRNNSGIPYGMWIEILDKPEKIIQQIILGTEHYKIESEWLRKLYIDNGMNPDDADTMKLLPTKVKGGIILTKHQHELSSTTGLTIRFSRT